MTAVMGLFSLCLKGYKTLLEKNLKWVAGGSLEMGQIGPIRPIGPMPCKTGGFALLIEQIPPKTAGKQSVTGSVPLCPVTFPVRLDEYKVKLDQFHVILNDLHGVLARFT